MKYKKGGLPPASDLDPDYLQWQASKGIRDSFWCPTNNHNAHLNSFTPKEKFFLRNYERYPVSAAGTARRPPYAQEPSGSYHTFVEDREAARRSASMKKKEEAGKENLEVTDLELDVGLKTKHQIQEEGREAKRISVDVISGRPLSHKEARALIASEEAWRLARVVTHTTPGDYEGTRPHDKTYSHYKYMGFAGHGAKTSFARRDGLSSKTRDAPFKRTVQVTTSTAMIRRSKAERREAEEAIRALEADLVTGKSIADLRASMRPTTAPVPQGSSPGAAKKEGGETAEDVLIEAWRRVHVTTHRAPQSYEGTRPYVQTYGMYKYHGFAGCGAKTSYAKNPKIDALKLLPE